MSRIAATSDPSTPNQIAAYFHCKKCVSERPDKTSPKEWSKISAGLSADGTSFQIWCDRHNVNIALVMLVPSDDEVPTEGWVDDNQMEVVKVEEDRFTREELIGGLGHYDGYDDHSGESYERKIDAIIDSIRMGRRRSGGN